MSNEVFFGLNVDRTHPITSAFVRRFFEFAAPLVLLFIYTTSTHANEPYSLNRVLNGHEGSVMSLQFSADGRTLGSSSRDKSIKLWDPISGTLRHTLVGHDQDVYQVTFSPHGDLLASCSGDMTIRFWDSAEVDSVAFSPDGQQLASGSKDTTLKIWNVATGQLMQTIIGHTGRIESLTFSPDGKSIASGGGGGDTSIRLWNASDRSSNVFLKTENFDSDGHGGNNNHLRSNSLRIQEGGGQMAKSTSTI